MTHSLPQEALEQTLKEAFMLHQKMGRLDMSMKMEAYPENKNKAHSKKDAVSLAEYVSAANF